jgi:Phage integrase, N-terminal SAM-like domain
MQVRTESAESKPKRIEDRLREAIRVRQMSRRTEETCVQWYKRYVVFHKLRYPNEMGGPEVERFLTHLARTAQ